MKKVDPSLIAMAIAVNIRATDPPPERELDINISSKAVRFAI